jgi:hypothetical protein
MPAPDDLITRVEVVELLRELGRPVSARSVNNYRKRPPSGWPQPVEYVGRTPRWRRQDIETYASSPRTGSGP